MYKGKILADTVVPANTPIPFATVYNTNTKTVPNQGVVNIRALGLWDVAAHLNVTGLTGEITAQFFINDDPEAIIYENVEAASETATLNLSDQLRVVPAIIPEKIEVSVQLSAEATVRAGSFLLVGERK